MKKPTAEGLKLHFSNNNRLRDIQGHSMRVHSVDWSCDGRRLASGSCDKTISIYSLDRDRLSKEYNFKGHSESVDQICWHPSHPDRLASASLDKSVKLWDCRSWKCTSNMPTKGENINVSWSPNGQTIAVGNKEDLVTFIDPRNHKITREYPFKFEVNEISWNNDNDLFFLTSGNGEVHVLSWPQLQTQIVLKAHPATCITIEFDPTGRYFAVGSTDAMVSIWDVKHFVCLRTISRLDWGARTLSFSHDGSMIATGSEDLMIDVSHVESGEKVAELPTETSTFTVAFHPKQHLLAFACDDSGRDAGTVKIFGFPNKD
ncbi:THO complex subunit 3 [Halotydeus destructor]|nr:THO complex subunit 3 [Halotydeus destructor]